MRCGRRFEKRRRPRISPPAAWRHLTRHRFGSALNHHVHLHACVADDVFVPAAAEAGGDAPPAILPTRPPFALERISVIRSPDGRATRVRYVLPRHKAANWVGPGRGRKSARPGAHGVAELSPFEFLDRLADLVPPPRKHRHRYHGVCSPNHRLRKAVTGLAIGNVGKCGDTAMGGPRRTTQATSRLSRSWPARRLGRARAGP